MKLQYLKSATVIIESKGVKILCDPWLVDGEYYGSWHHNPPFNFNEEDYQDVDYIYISHIHPDHFSIKTLEKLHKTIPVLIHKFAAPFLKENIERLGFQVLELPHNKRTALKNGIHINILAADDCNPEICLKFFGCGIYKGVEGSAQIDSIAVIDDGRYVVVNVNDCPYQLAYSAAARIREQYPQIDFLLLGYAGAGPFPQCFPEFSDEDKLELAERKKLQFLDQALEYIKAFQPEFYMPFAGTYTLGGKLSHLNRFRGIPEMEEAVGYLEKRNSGSSKGILLNSLSYFDLERREASEEYTPVDQSEKKKYIREVLYRVTYDYEQDPVPELKELVNLIPSSFERMDKRRQAISFSSPTKVRIPLVEGKTAEVSMNGEGFEVIDADELKEVPYVQFKLDPRLLHLILSGPKYAHWQNAEIGSHIEFSRKPEQFERGLYYSMNFFHK